MKLKINEEISEQTSEFMVAHLYDLREKYPLFQNELNEEKILKIKKTMIEVLKEIAKNNDKISIYAHYDGNELLDEIFEKSDISFKGNLISKLAYPNDFCCTIYKNYATYVCNPETKFYMEYKVPETIIALKRDGVKEIIEQANKLAPLGKTYRDKKLLLLKEVENYLDRNNIDLNEKLLEKRIEKLNDFKPKYNSWEFLYRKKESYSDSKTSLIDSGDIDEIEASIRKI